MAASLLLFTLMMFDPGEPLLTVPDEEASATAEWLRPDGWDCVSPDGADRLLIQYQRPGLPPLRVERWRHGQKVAPLTATCGPDSIIGSRTAIDLTSDLCDNWRLRLKLDGSETSATLNLVWAGQDFGAFRCGRGAAQERG